MQTRATSDFSSKAPSPRRHEEGVFLNLCRPRFNSSFWNTLSDWHMARGSPLPASCSAQGFPAKPQSGPAGATWLVEATGKHLTSTGSDQPGVNTSSWGPSRADPVSPWHTWAWASLLGALLSEAASPAPLEGAGGKCRKIPHLSSGHNLPCALLGAGVGVGRCHVPPVPCQAQKSR